MPQLKETKKKPSLGPNMDRSSEKRVFYHFAIQAPV